MARYSLFVLKVPLNPKQTNHQTGYVGKVSDHLQLIKFWPSCAPGNGAAAAGEYFWPAL